MQPKLDTGHISIINEITEIAVLIGHCHVSASYDGATCRMFANSAPCCCAPEHGYRTQPGDTNLTLSRGGNQNRVGEGLQGERLFLMSFVFSPEGSGPPSLKAVCFCLTVSMFRKPFVAVVTPPAPPLAKISVSGCLQCL